MLTEAARHASIENNKRRIARLVRLLRETDEQAGAHAQTLADQVMMYRGRGE